MIAKPIYSYPDATSVALTDNHLNLYATYSNNCSLETFIGDDGIEYCYATLFLIDDLGCYRIKSQSKTPFYPRVYRDDQVIKVEYIIDLTNSDLYGEIVRAQEQQYEDTISSIRAGCDKTVKTGIIKSNSFKFYINNMSSGNIYRWKIRVYEKGSILNMGNYIPSVSIGYGVTQGSGDVPFPEGNESDNNQAGKKQSYSQGLTVLKIFPHTNICDYVLGQTTHQLQCDNNVTSANQYYQGHVKRIYDLRDKYTVPILCSPDEYYEVKGTGGVNPGVRQDMQLLDFTNSILSIINEIDENASYFLRINGKNYKIKRYNFTGFCFIEPIPLGDANSYKAKGRSKYLEYSYDGTTNVCDIHDCFIDYANAIPEKKYYSGQYIQKGDIGEPEIGSMSGKTKLTLYSAFAQDNNMFDSYGNPIAGYVLLEGDASEAADKEMRYSVMCNYIDSDEVYFELHTPPKFEIMESVSNVLLTDESGNLMLGTEQSPYILSHSNIDLNVTSVQSEGINHISYKYKIYEVCNDGVYKPLYESDNEYNCSINIKYDDFLNNSKYKILLTVTYSNNVSYDIELYLNTIFGDIMANTVCKAEYYRNHNSVIVEWDKIYSVVPHFLNSNYSHIGKYVYIESANEMIYDRDDTGNDLNFKDCILGLKFKTTPQSGKIANLNTPDNVYTISALCLNNINDDYIDSIVITVNHTKYIYSIESNDDEYAVIIYPNQPPIIKNVTIDKLIDISSTEHIDYDINIENSCIILYGDTYFSEMFVINNSNNEILENAIDNTPEWTENTLLICKYEISLNGGNIFTTLYDSKLIGYDIYKTIGKDSELHKICEINNLNNHVIEDFIIGDSCEYQYIVCPIFESTRNNRAKIKIGQINSNSIFLNQGVNKIVGLQNIHDNIYRVNLDEVWRLSLNLEDNGYTLNNSKSFIDSLGKYSQEYVGGLNYITKSVSGMIGMIDCYSSERELFDDYDMLTSWNDFATSSSLKCYIDSRGLILPGNFEQNPTVEYIKCQHSYATAKFNYRQKSDLNIMKIYATIIPFNPLHSSVMSDINKRKLISKDNELLIVKDGGNT